MTGPGFSSLGAFLRFDAAATASGHLEIVGVEVPGPLRRANRPP